MKRRGCLGLLAGAGIGALAGTHAAAAEYAWTQPMHIIVPFPPGGGTDLVARLLAERLTPRLDTPVIVDNRPGCNSIIATRAVAGAPPDGSVFGLTTDIHAINAAFAQSLPFDSVRDFVFVCQLTTSPLMLVAHPGVDVRTLGELVTLARAQPGRLSFASLGPSSPHHLGFEWFKRMAGIDVVDVPYKGGGQALVDVMGGQVQLSLVVAGNGMRQVRAGKLVALAVTSAQRNAAAPEVPTFAESGFPEFSLMNWYALLGPAGTPQSAVARLARECATVLREPSAVEKIAAAGLEVAVGTPAEAAELVRGDIERWRRIIKLTDARPQGN